MENPTELIGTIHRPDVVEAYNHEIQMRDLLGSVDTSLTTVSRTRSANLAPGIAMAEIELPSHYAGKDLRTLDLRRKKGIEVILVREGFPGFREAGKVWYLNPILFLNMETYCWSAVHRKSLNNWRDSDLVILIFPHFSSHVKRIQIVW